MCAVASFSLSSLTSGGVVGVIFSINSSIFYLYLSIVYAIFCIFSSVVTSSSYVQSSMLMYTSMSFFSSLFACCFYSSFSSVILSQVTCNNSLTSLSIYRLVASTLALDWTSCITLTCNPYNAFVVMCARTKLRCSMSFTCFYAMLLSTSNISCVTLNMSLPFTTICAISSYSFCTGASCAFSFCCAIG
jgi:hypothetical protein